ncbi:Uncharacterized protein BP5553_09027 [Venustampulla echinocandica]|uniref:Nucleoporin NUP37 n=1 Tax=Venustampulla echinocandica TaxID=2656787 RepID=A0A370TDR6_9HELO|nr:Uncharacterized protein BP5553_09027 [Venustampulla echinocandica]RDL32571.1 Uncharacterized protein BP5553_09027 [Venustampulla echinocandica]
MAPNLRPPRISRNQQNTQLSYELPQRIHTAKTYPRLSPNGSTVILYGLENGVRVVWRGGKAFKAPSEPSAASQKANGAEDAVILLDSDDEAGPPQKFDDKPEFEDEEEEVDPLKPHPEILQTLDLHLGTNVFHIALLPTAVLKAEGATWRGLEPLKQKIVFTASCGDNDLRLITLPLIPPSPASKARPEFRSSFAEAYAGNGRWGETVTLLKGHQSPSAGVAMTASFGTSPKNNSNSSATAGAQIIVASHSLEVTGLLLLYRISVKSQPRHVEPFQKIHLASPAKSISFNPSLSGQRSSHLLLADTKGTCRIYDYSKLSTSSEEGSESTVAERGTWLLPLYAPFQGTKDNQQAAHPMSAHAGFGRKTIIDAQWVSGGKAVIVLLDDGEWGIWDIEGYGPGASKGGLQREGVNGGSVSEFSLVGYIDIAAKPRQSGAPQITGPKFVPMTPSTRKAIELFSKCAASNGIVNGQISVAEIRSSSPTSPSEESVAFWLGETFALISNLQKYWTARNSKPAKGGQGNLFGGGPSGSGLIRLEGIDLQGEQCSGIEQLTKRAPTQADLPTDLLILGEHRFTILSIKSQTKEVKARVPSSRSALEEKTGNNAMDLDVIGIDQALARMENVQPKRGKLFGA